MLQRICEHYTILCAASHSLARSESWKLLVTLAGSNLDGTLPNSLFAPLVDLQTLLLNDNPVSASNVFFDLTHDLECSLYSSHAHCELPCNLAAASCQPQVPAVLKPCTHVSTAHSPTCLLHVIEMVPKSCCMPYVANYAHNNMLKVSCYCSCWRGEYPTWDK